MAVSKCVKKYLEPKDLDDFWYVAQTWNRTDLSSRLWGFRKNSHQGCGSLKFWSQMLLKSNPNWKGNSMYNGCCSGSAGFFGLFFNCGRFVGSMKSHPLCRLCTRTWYKISQLSIRIQLMRRFHGGKRMYLVLGWRNGWRILLVSLKLNHPTLTVILTCQKIPFFSSKSVKCPNVFYICWIWIIAILGRFRLFSRFCFKIWICFWFCSHCW